MSCFCCEFAWRHCFKGKHEYWWTAIKCKHYAMLFKRSTFINTWYVYIFSESVNYCFHPEIFCSYTLHRGRELNVCKTTISSMYILCQDCSFILQIIFSGKISWFLKIAKECIKLSRAANLFSKNSKVKLKFKAWSTKDNELLHISFWRN